MKRRSRPVAMLVMLACLSLAGGVVVASRAPARLIEVSAHGKGAQVAVLIAASEPVAYSTSQPDPFTVLVELRNVRVSGVVNRLARSGRGPVSTVDIEESAAVDGTTVARLHVRLSAPAAHRVRSRRATIRLEFDSVAAVLDPMTALEPMGAPSAAAGEPGLMPAAQVAVATTPEAQPAPAVAQPPPPQPSPPAPTPATPPPPQETQLVAGQRQFTGFPISLDFQNADLRAVLRTFAEITGLNVVIDPQVQGAVDVSLRDVAWDQALDIILRANKLGYIVDGTVVRIAPLTVLADEESQRRKLAEEQALAGQLRVLTKTLSYARAASLSQLLLKAVLSQRGQVQVDERTNMLIITDLQDRLDAAANLIGTLDQPQPQVEIEARVVQTTRDFARQIGVQWGLNGRVAPELGNTTPLAFPNQGSLSGRTGIGQAPQDTRGNAARDTSATAVNLPVSGATGAIGLALGSINGAFNLDVALSALERSGQGRILSTPRVTTQNNVAAEMTQGVQIPIQTVANNTVVVTFKDAALMLKVTPQITAAGTVIMNVSLENAAPDFSRSVGGIPPIDTQRANTTVQVNDGETAVIGGIFVSRQQSVQDRTPLLYRIPLLGWLFKRDALTDESRELLIFITPRILR